jgi:xanthine/uracil permease
MSRHMRHGTNKDAMGALFLCALVACLAAWIVGWFRK